MEQNNIGLIIKQLRLKKNITQEELASGICSVSQLYRIERGKHFPSVIILQQISEKLAEDISKYILFSNCTNPIHFSNLFNQLEQLRLQRKYNDILQLISDIKNEPEFFFDINIPNIKQSLGWYTGVSITNIDPQNICIEYYFELLKLTTNFCDLNELFESILSINEIKIIHSIAATYCRLNNFSIAKHILLSLIDNLETFNANLDISLITEIYYNLAKILCIQKEYKDAITYSNKGIAICIDNNYCRVLGDLFYISGKCYESLDDVFNSIKNFSKFIYLYDILGHDEFSLKCKENLLQIYGDKIVPLHYF